MNLIGSVREWNALFLWADAHLLKDSRFYSSKEPWLERVSSI